MNARQSGVTVICSSQQEVQHDFPMSTADRFLVRKILSGEIPTDKLNFEVQAMIPEMIRLSNDCFTGTGSYEGQKGTASIATLLAGSGIQAPVPFDIKQYVNQTWDDMIAYERRTLLRRAQGHFDPALDSREDIARAKKQNQERNKLWQRYLLEKDLK